MPIVRELYEDKRTELGYLHSDLSDKTTPITEAETRQLKQLTSEVQGLKDQLAVIDPGDQLWRAMHEQNDQKMAEAKSFLKRLGQTKSGSASSSSKDDGDFARLSFSREQVADLQRGALNRQVTTKAAITSGTAAMGAVPQYQLQPFPFLRDKQRILDLISQQRTEAPAVHYFKGTTAASAATAVAEGAAKPESTPAWTEVTATVRKLAHYTRVNDEVIADFDTFLNVVGAELLSGLIDRENQQLITGTGVAPNLLGLAAEPNILTVGSAGTDLDAIAAAFLALRTGSSHCDPDVVVMNPADWYSAGFMLAKETGGAYLLGNPVSAVKPMLWGVPVVLSEHMTESSALVANLKVACTAYVRQPPVVEVAPYGGGTTEFIANQTLIRAEERLALAIHHPTAICSVTAV